MYGTEVTAPPSNMPDCAFLALHVPRVAVPSKPDGDLRFATADGTGDANFSCRYINAWHK